MPITRSGNATKQLLARANVDLQLVPSAGSVQNRALLRDPRSGVSVALIEGGVGTEADSSQLQSLGTMFYEPVWWFYRPEIAESGPDALRGRKVSIGPEGSGTRALSIELIQRAGTLGQFAQVLPFSPRTAAEKLMAGDIDTAFMLSSWDSPVVQALLADDRIALSGFPHADAMVAIYPFLSKLVLPKGVTDIPKERPLPMSFLSQPRQASSYAGTCIRLFSICCSMRRRRFIRGRASSMLPTGFRRQRQLTFR